VLPLPVVVVVVVALVLGLVGVSLPLQAVLTTAPAAPSSSSAWRRLSSLAGRFTILSVVLLFGRGNSYVYI
jgi:hypothetical protein